MAARDQRLAWLVLVLVEVVNPFSVLGGRVRQLIAVLVDEPLILTRRFLASFCSFSAIAQPRVVRLDLYDHAEHRARPPLPWLEPAAKAMPLRGYRPGTGGRILDATPGSIWLSIGGTYPSTAGVPWPAVTS